MTFEQEIIQDEENTVKNEKAEVENDQKAKGKIA